MAEMLGSALVGVLVKKIASFLSGNYEMQKGVKDKLERLDELLMMIQSAVEAAEGRQIVNPWLLRWLRGLKEAAYDADDVIDTFDYRILEEKANNDDDKVSSSFASSSSNAAKRMRTAARCLFSCDEDVKELSSVVEKLERVAADLGDFLKVLEMDGSSKKLEITNRRITSSSLRKNQSVGTRRKSRSSAFCNNQNLVMLEMFLSFPFLVLEELARLLLRSSCAKMRG
ncbi:putative disease resistance protein At1g50180 [Typha latifolia]|uniref:putative disease resistance protein At1g50180 n=1 Tax=Typha latifolia TaxID=4733 RepID=UPI003C2E5C5C